VTSGKRKSSENARVDKTSGYCIKTEFVRRRQKGVNLKGRGVKPLLRDRTGWGAMQIIREKVKVGGPVVGPNVTGKGAGEMERETI